MIYSRCLSITFMIPSLNCRVNFHGSFVESIIYHIIKHNHHTYLNQNHFLAFSHYYSSSSGQKLRLDAFLWILYYNNFPFTFCPYNYTGVKHLTITAWTYTEEGRIWFHRSSLLYCVPYSWFQSYRRHSLNIVCILFCILFKINIKRWGAVQWWWENLTNYK